MITRKKINDCQLLPGCQLSYNGDAKVNLNHVGCCRYLQNMYSFHPERRKGRLKSALSIDFHFKIEIARGTNQAKRWGTWGTTTQSLLGDYDVVFFFKRVQNKLLKEHKIVAGLQQKKLMSFTQRIYSDLRSKYA